MFRLPLYGIRVLELGAGWAVAYAARLLADMGAEVIKVESPGQRGDEPPLADRLNRNKYSLSLGLSGRRGKELLLCLVPLCDVVVKGRLSGGLTFAALRKANPDLILATISGRDDSEEAADAPYGMAGVAAAGAVALALWHRRHSGQGQHIEVDVPKAETIPAINMTDALADPYLRARGFFEPVAHHDPVGVWEMDGVPWRLSESPAHVRLPAPRLGEHTDYVLRHLLGLSQEEVAALARDGVTGHRPDWAARE